MVLEVTAHQFGLTPCLLKWTLHRLQWALLSVGGYVVVAAMLTLVLPQVALASEVFTEVLSVDPVEGQKTPAAYSATIWALQGFQWAQVSVGGYVLSFDPHCPTLLRALQREVGTGGVVVTGYLFRSTHPGDGLVGALVAAMLTLVPPQVALASEVFTEVLSVDPVDGQNKNMPATIWALQGFPWAQLSVVAHIFPPYTQRSTPVWTSQWNHGASIIVCPTYT